MARVFLAMLIAVGVSAVSAAQGHQSGSPGQMCCGGMMHDDDHAADMAMFQALIDHRHQIHRTVVKRADGVETVTESDDPQVTKLIQTHVNAMYGRVKEGRAIHLRDPLFKAIFENHDKIVMAHEMTPRGIKVVETSADPYTVRLIQAHADVLDLFIKNGRSEMMKNHDVPEKPR
jgi:uncharacterized protein